MNRRTAAALDDLAGCITIAIRELGLNDLQHPHCVTRLLEARAELSTIFPVARAIARAPEKD